MFLEGLRLLGNPAECSVEPMSVFVRVWPQALVLLALVLTVMWMGVLGYGAVSLTELAYGYCAAVAKAWPELAVETTAPDMGHIIR